jgi:hypothetical protein
MTYIEKYRQEHKDKSEFDLIILSEAAHKGTPEHQVVLALLHEKKVAREVDQHRRTRRLTKIGIALTAIGILVGVWLHFQRVADSASTMSIPTAQPKSSPSAKPAP